MEIFHLVRGESPRRIASLERMPDDGFIWLDLIRGDEQGWEAWLRRLLAVELDPRHIEDSRDAAHKSFFDVTPHYDLLIFEDIGPQTDPLMLETRNAAMFLFDRLLVTVRAPDNASFSLLKQRFANGTTKSPANVRVLAEMLLDNMVDRFLAISESFNQGLDALQESLLDPKSPFTDWQKLLDGRRDARRIEWLCKGQLKALERWHRNSAFEWTNSEETRLNDLSEHITLVRDASADLERHIEAAIQIYFASTSHRTNEIVRTLTVFSAIFLPLTFLAGVYGMNFRQMPELGLSFAYPVLLAVMALIAAVLLWAFRRRGYF